jgi:uncharacterized membrane protein
MIFAYKKHNYPAEFIGLTGCACALLALAVIFPSISTIVNMTRCYHYALFMVSPMFVVGAEFIANRIKHD